MKDQDLLALKEQRGKLIADARKLVDAADGESRALNAEEREGYDKHLDDADKLKDRIDDEERVRKAEAEAVATTRQVAPAQPDPKKPEARTTDPESTEFRYELPTGQVRTIPIGGPFATSEYRAAFGNWLRFGKDMNPEEARALQVTDQTIGGALTPDMQFVATLIKFVDNFVHVRQRATVFQLPSADSLGAPSLDTDIEDSTWTTEIGTADEDTAMAFGRRELVPSPMAKLIKVSKTLLRKAPGTESLVRDRMAYKIGVTQEKGFLTGTGANQPLGVFTAHANGITTGQDVSTGNTTTAIGADNLRRVKYNLKPQYRASSTTAWMFHRDAVRNISLLKDGNGQYLWMPGITMADPDRILNIPVMESEYAPNTFTTGLYVGILGDWSMYWIVDSLAMTIQRLEELYAATNQTGFISRSETDGMPVLEEAFSRVTLA